MFKKNCLFCGVSFSTTRKDKFYCKNPHDITCVSCGVVFVRKLIKNREFYSCGEKDCENNLRKLTNKSRYGVDNPLKSLSVKRKVQETNLKRYGYTTNLLFPETQSKVASAPNRVSKINIEWQERLYNAFGVKFLHEVSFGGTKHADLGYENILIDINPSFTHNSSISFVHGTGRCKDKNCSKNSHLPTPPDYHQQRALIAENEKKILFQYFDWFDKTNFMNLIAREMGFCKKTAPTNVKIISLESAQNFYNENYLFPYDINSNVLCVGLFIQDDLVFCQIYSEEQQNWAIISECMKNDYNIVNADQKCEQYFIENFGENNLVKIIDMNTRNRFSLDDSKWEHVKTTPSEPVFVDFDIFGETCSTRVYSAGLSVFSYNEIRAL